MRHPSKARCIAIAAISHLSAEYKKYKSKTGVYERRSERYAFNTNVASMAIEMRIGVIQNFTRIVSQSFSSLERKQSFTSSEGFANILSQWMMGPIKFQVLSTDDPPSLKRDDKQDHYRETCNGGREPKTYVQQAKAHQCYVLRQ